MKLKEVLGLLDGDVVSVERVEGQATPQSNGTTDQRAPVLAADFQAPKKRTVARFEGDGQIVRVWKMKF